MNTRDILYVVIVSLISFIIWGIGVAVIIVTGMSMLTARIWAAAVFAAACAWSVCHIIRRDKKIKEEEENDNYKGVY